MSWSNRTTTACPRDLDTADQRRNHAGEARQLAAALIEAADLLQPNKVNRR